MADITATLTGQVTITGELTVPMGIVPRGEIEVNENGEYDVTNYETANVAVPQPSGSVTITENGEHDVTDYVTADVQVPQPSGSIEITENGEFDVADFVQAVVDVPTGATNIVSGTFKAPSTAGDQETISIPYNGIGYPILLAIFPVGGLINPDTLWGSSVSRYSVGAYLALKSNPDVEPLFSDSSPQDTAFVADAIKNSSSSATSLSSSTVPSHQIFHVTVSGSGAANAVAITSKSTFRYRTRQNSTYGLQPSVDYQYIVIYSE